MAKTGPTYTEKNETAVLTEFPHEGRLHETGKWQLIKICALAAYVVIICI